MAKVGPNAVNLAIAEMIGQLLTFTTHPTGHFMKVPKSFLYCNVQSTIDYIFQTIKGHLSPS